MKAALGSEDERPLILQLEMPFIKHISQLGPISAQRSSNVPITSSKRSRDLEFSGGGPSVKYLVCWVLCFVRRNALPDPVFSAFDHWINSLG